MDIYLVHSKDEKIWYWQSFDLISQVFKSREAAVKTMKGAQLIWKKEKK